MNKITGALIFAFIAVALTAYFWKNQVITTIFLVMLAFLKQKVFPVKKPLVWYLVTFFLGPITESLIMWLGSGPWIYVQHTVFNFPFWLPFLWGMAGLIAATLYEGFGLKFE